MFMLDSTFLLSNQVCEAGHQCLLDMTPKKREVIAVLTPISNINFSFISNNP